MVRPIEGPPPIPPSQPPPPNEYQLKESMGKHTEELANGLDALLIDPSLAQDSRFQQEVAAQGIKLHHIVQSTLQLH